jgi:hypothetical protein
MECRILDYNYVAQSSTVVSASSANAEFPVSNIPSTLRSKIWRSAGNFVIGATNNKLDFKISGGGSQLTATIASGTYTPAGLAAAIVAALAAQDGAHTYTVSFSALTGLWSISTSGTFLSLLWATGSNTAVSVGPTIGFSADGTGATSYTAPAIALHTEEWILIDMLVATPIDSFALFMDAMRGVQFSSNAQLWIQAAPTNSWASPAINQALTIDTTFDVVSYFWSSPQTYRYWRLRVVDPANANLCVEVSKIVLAQATQLSRVPKNGFSFTQDDQSTIQRTLYGHEYADIYPTKKLLGFNYGGLTYADIQALDAIYRRVGRAQPLVIAMDDTGTTFNKNHFMIYGKFKTPFQPMHSIGSYFDQAVTFEETF